MTCGRRGGVAAAFAIFTIALVVVTLLPHIFWSKYDGDKAEFKYSLWRNCTDTCAAPVNGTCISNCHNLGLPKKTDYKSEATAERDGALAGCFLAGVFSLASLLAICCRSRCGSLAMTILSFIFICVAVGCWVRFQTNTLDNSLKASENGGHFKFSAGFILVCVAVITSATSVAGSCCISKERDAYEFLA